MDITFSQFFPPAPALTELNLPSQEGKVFIVTGGASGIGFELSRILYQAGGKVYIAGRSRTNAEESIQKIKSLSINAEAPVTGHLEFLHLELDDLTSIKRSVEEFRSKEEKLDVLWNNAGVSLQSMRSWSKQNYDLMMATNCLGPFLFTQLLLPSLVAASEASPPGQNRVEVATSTPDQVRNYLVSKIGNWFLASELARREDDRAGILSVVQNPGDLNTNLMRHKLWMKYMSYLLLYKAAMSAYTELWAGLSQEIGMGENGAYVIPWGKLHPSPRAELVKCLRGPEEGGTGVAAEFWSWCEEETKKYC
ncbi:short-chain dehydrogenase [Bisporella sp. PMI_857]|nr:short-chain dehydrogenase [Bisporella sp. PMI_857]